MDNGHSLGAMLKYAKNFLHVSHVKWERSLYEFKNAMSCALSGKNVVATKNE